MVKIWSEWNVARLVLPVSAIVVLFWTAGLWTAMAYIFAFLFHAMTFFLIMHTISL